MQQQTNRASFLAALESLIEAANAFRNFRALLLLGLTLVSAALLGTLFATLAGNIGSTALGVVGALLALLVVFYGSNAVGIMLMHEAQQKPTPSLADALLLSLFSSHRLILVMILEMLIVLLAVAAIAVLLFVCKIPALGPVLFTLVFPVSAVFLGLLVFALFYIMLPLAGPAVWSGSTVFQVLARLGMLVRVKLIPIILLEVLLSLITLFFASLVFSVVLIGVGMTSGLSAGILGVGGGLGGMQMMLLLASGSGYPLAAAIGGGLLFALAAIVPGLVFTKGVCIIYLDAVRGLDFSQPENSLNQGLASVRKKAEQARARAQQLGAQPGPRASASPAPAASPVATCPHCAAPIADDDVFCGNCAYRLKPG